MTMGISTKVFLKQFMVGLPHRMQKVTPTQIIKLKKSNK